MVGKDNSIKVNSCNTRNVDCLITDECIWKVAEDNELTIVGSSTIPTYSEKTIVNQGIVSIVETVTDIVYSDIAKAVHNENENVKERNQVISDYYEYRVDLLTKDDAYVTAMQAPCYNHDSQTCLQLNSCYVQATAMEKLDTHRESYVDKYCRRVFDHFLERSGTHTRENILDAYDLREQLKLVKAVALVNLHSSRLRILKHPGIHPLATSKSDEGPQVVIDDNKSCSTKSSRSKVSRLTRRTILGRISQIGTTRKGSEEIDEVQEFISMNTTVVDVNNYIHNNRLPDTSVQAMSWSKVDGNQFIVALANENHSELLVWNIIDPRTPQTTIPLSNTIIFSLEFNPWQNIVAIGFKSGVVACYNLDDDEIFEINPPSLLQYECTEPIVHMSWLEKSTLFSLTMYGFLVTWQLRKYTEVCSLQLVKKICVYKEICLSMCTVQSTNIGLVIAAAGKVYTVSKPITDHPVIQEIRLRDKLQDNLLTKIAISPFHLDVVLIATSAIPNIYIIELKDTEEGYVQKSDGIFLTGEKHLELECITDATWSRVSPLHIFGVSTRNQIYFWDIALQHNKALKTIKLDFLPVCIMFSPYDNAFCVGDERGNCILYKVEDEKLLSGRRYRDIPYQLGVVSEQKAILSQLLSSKDVMNSSLNSF